MDKKPLIVKCLAVGIILLFIGTNIAPSGVSQVHQSNIFLNSFKTIIVDDEGDGDYRFIQEALDNATQGDIIKVYSGTFNEKIIINMTLIIEGIASEYETGDDTGKPVIIYNGSSAVVTLHAKGCTFRGFSIINNDKSESSAGIRLFHASNTNISENSIFNCYHAIDLTSDYFTENCSIFKNNCSYCSEGMHISDKNHIIVNGNTFFQCKTGIHFYCCRNCKVSNNIFIGKNSTDGILGIYITNAVNLSIFYNHIENFFCGLYIEVQNAAVIEPSKEIGKVKTNFLSLLQQFNNRRKSIDFSRSSNISSRAFNIHHNNFINNTENALVYFLRAPLYFLTYATIYCLLAFVLSLIIYKEVDDIIYPYPFVLQIQFNYNYWDDKPIQNSTYKIDTYWIRLGPLLFIIEEIIYIIEFLTFNPDLFDFEINGFPIPNFDAHPINEPYDIGASI